MKIVKELVIALKLCWILCRYYSVSTKRMKWILKMVKIHEKYSDCDFVMEATKDMYKELFEHICKAKGEMQIGKCEKAE